ncbi:MAG: DnaJ domain-containing protein [Flavobacteriaceae bacterium]|nr:DnaJ domain-containing protein [Flavobacteriaceae bacterium]NNL79788.1 DnaJ domain-containing protein [Flavobacteriaceae bacterium]
MPAKNYYQILGINKDASLEIIKKAFREKVSVYHPDVNEQLGARSKFEAVIEAFDVLSDKEKKSQYDEMVKQENSYEPLYPEQELVIQEWEDTSKRRSENYSGMALEELLMLGLIAETGVVDGLLDSAGDIIDSAADAMDGLFDLF